MQISRATRHSERSFGLTVGAACALIAGYQIWHGRALAGSAFALLATLLMGSAVATPYLLRAPRAMWFRVAGIVGWVNSRVLLTVLFVLVFTPMGFATRALGRDPLRRRWRAGAPGWTPYPATRRNPRHYERMF